MVVSRCYSMIGLMTISGGNRNYLVELEQWSFTDNCRIHIRQEFSVIQCNNLMITGVGGGGRGRGGETPR